MPRKRKPLAIGRKVTVRRLTGEEVRGVIASEPIPHLSAIGEFYMIAQRALDAEYYRGSGRKSRKREQYEAESGRIGMYERAFIRL